MAGLGDNQRVDEMSELIRLCAEKLLSERPQIGTPEWTEWHSRCVKTAQRLAENRFDFSYMEFWKACGMPS
jgi:hypothetical protein